MALRVSQIGKPAEAHSGNTAEAPLAVSPAPDGGTPVNAMEQQNSDSVVDPFAQVSLALGGGLLAQVAALAVPDARQPQKLEETRRAPSAPETKPAAVPVEIRKPVVMDVPEALRSRIVDAALEMSLVQAMAPGEKDGTGFSNADYPFGAVAATVGDAQACALLLLGYPDQIGAHGLSRDDLTWAVPEESRSDLSAMRHVAHEELGAKRDENRGKVAWTEKSDTVLLVPYGGLWEDKRVLRQLAVKTPVGYEVDKQALGRVLDQLKGEILNKEALDAIAQAYGSRGTATASEATRCKIQVCASQIQGDRWAITYNDPSSTEGLKVKEAVKAIAGRRAFDGLTSSSRMTMTYAQTQVLAVMLTEMENVDPTGLPVHPDNVSASYRREAELLLAGVMPIKVNGVNSRGKILFATVDKNDALYQACQAAEIRQNGPFFEAEPAQVIALVEQLTGVGSLDCSELVKKARGVAKETLRTMQEARSALEQARANVGALVIPDVTPSGKTLFPHQPEAIRFLLTAELTDVNLHGAILADDMGLGKSVEAIMAAYLKAPEGKKLVVCPASLRLNWAKEIGIWLGPEEKARAQVLSAGGKAINPDTRWLIINYDLLQKYAKDLEKWKPEIAIYDEAHLLKSAKALRSEVVVGEDIKVPDEYTGKNHWYHEPGLAEKIPSNWPLTGTPIKNKTSEIFNLLRMIGHELGQDFVQFGIRYCDGHQVSIGPDRVVWDFDGASNLPELGEKLRPVFLKREKADVLNLPPKIESIVPVELTAAQMKAYKQALGDLLGDDFESDGSESQKVPGEVLRRMTAAKMQTAIAKIPAAMDMIDIALGNGQKIVVFSTYHEVLNQLQERYKDLAVRLDGNTPNKKRQAVVDAFQEDPTKMVFLGQTEAAGVGTTLTAAQEELVNDWPWVPGDYKQIRDRIHRIGQTGTCNIRGLCAEGTFDEILQATLKEKIELIEAVERAIKEGKVVDPEILAKANEDVAMAVFKKIKEEARRMDREEKEQRAAKAAKGHTIKKAVNE